MEFTKKFKAYILVDPITETPRYVGITKRTINQRFSGHLSDVYRRPESNPHKTAWFKKLMKGGKLPYIKQIAEFDTEKELQQFEIDYIAKYKEKYNLINMTKGGESLGEHIYDREVILKKSTTKPITQYNVLGEKIADYEITEDARRELGLSEKACTHITQCCKGTRRNAYGYIWRYKNEPLGDISNINPKSLSFNKLVQYDESGNRIAEYDSYLEASRAIGDSSKGGNISAVITGKQKTCKGFTFQLEPIYIYFDQNLYDSTFKLDKTISTGNKNKIKIICENIETAEKISFDSYSEAAKYIGNYNWRSKIKECCENLRKDWQGYKFYYNDQGPL